MNLLSELASYLVRENEIDAKPTIYPIRLDVYTTHPKTVQVSYFLPNSVFNAIWNNKCIPFTNANEVFITVEEFELATFIFVASLKKKS